MKSAEVDESYRKRAIRAVTFLAGLYFFLEFLLPESVLQTLGVSAAHSHISTGFIVVGTMAFGLGIINLFRVHGTKVVFRRKDWAFSFALLTGLICMMTVTGLDWLSGLSVTEKNAEYRNLGLFTEAIVSDAGSSPEEGRVLPPKQVRLAKLIEASHRLAQETGSSLDVLTDALPSQLKPEKRALFQQFSSQLRGRITTIVAMTPQELSSDEEILSFGRYLNETGVLYEKLLRMDYDVSLIKKVYLFFFEGLFVSLGSAMFSLLGVYIASAAYRAFRIKTVESFLMMMAALLVMLGQIPFYEYISGDLPAVRQWLLEVPNTAAFRAIKIGAAIAGLVMAFRMWFSIESESFSQQGGK
ncbi:hypothetical protein MRY87_00875 [bacterium]|nr:hypothetical protein [bacterium]